MSVGAVILRLVPGKLAQLAIPEVQKLGVLAAGKDPDHLRKREGRVQCRSASENPSLARIRHGQRNMEQLLRCQAATRLPRPFAAHESPSHSEPEIVGILGGETTKHVASSWTAANSWPHYMGFGYEVNTSFGAVNDRMRGLHL